MYRIILFINIIFGAGIILALSDIVSYDNIDKIMNIYVDKLIELKDNSIKKIINFLNKFITNNTEPIIENKSIEIKSNDLINSTNSFNEDNKASSVYNSSISRKDYNSSNNINIDNNLPSRKFYNSPYFYIPIIISSASLGLYYYNGDITNYLGINIMSLLIFLSGIVGGSGRPDKSDDNNLTEMDSDISLQDLSNYFQSPKSESSTLPYNPSELNTHNPFKSDSPKLNIYPLPDIKYMDPWDIDIEQKSYSLPVNPNDPFNQSNQTDVINKLNRSDSMDSNITIKPKN